MTMRHFKYHRALGPCGPAAALQVSHGPSISQRAMSRKLGLFFALIALAFSNVLMVPDVHAQDTGAFAHAADHIFEHGQDHFSSDDTDFDEDAVGHQPVHHHNCSFSLPDYASEAGADFSRRVSLRAPLSDNPLGSRASPVLIQPPIA